LRKRMNELALFAGGGGGLLATQHLLGFRTVCYVEIDPYCVEILKARMRDGVLDDAPIWDDARTFDGKPWRGCVDLVTAGFPCQAFSCAGTRRGKNDSRNLWPDTIRIVKEVRPAAVLLENSPDLRCSRRKKGDKAPSQAGYLGQVLGDLAQCGFDARWSVLSARALGAPHLRRRLWIVAHARDERCVAGRQHAILQGESVVDARAAGDASDTHGQGELQPCELLSESGERVGDCAEGVTNAASARPPQRQAETTASTALPTADGSTDRCGWWGEWPAEPALCGVDDGVAHRGDRIRALGEGQIPIVAATAWRLLSAR